MSLILNIETATQFCSIGVSENGHTLALRESSEKNIHAAKVTVFTEDACRDAHIRMQDLDAIAVSMGPGSYTGLRIGVSAAKGFCYALDIPLIAVPTLQSMALGALLSMKDETDPELLWCPMIDARRMEVYTGLFDNENKEVRKIEALIIKENSYEIELEKHRIIYFGDGADKCRELLDPSGMVFLGGINPSASSMAIISHKKFQSMEFEDLAYFEPYYLKDFIAGIPKVKGLE